MNNIISFESVYNTGKKDMGIPFIFVTDNKQKSNKITFIKNIDYLGVRKPKSSSIKFTFEFKNLTNPNNKIKKLNYSFTTNKDLNNSEILTEQFSIPFNDTDFKNNDSYEVSVYSSDFRGLCLLTEQRYDTFDYEFKPQIGQNIIEIKQWGDFKFGNFNVLNLASNDVIFSDENVPEFTFDSPFLFYNWTINNITNFNSLFKFETTGVLNQILLNKLGGDIRYTFAVSDETKVWNNDRLFDGFFVRDYTNIEGLYCNRIDFKNNRKVMFNKLLYGTANYSFYNCKNLEAETLFFHEGLIEYGITDYRFTFYNCEKMITNNNNNLPYFIFNTKHKDLKMNFESTFENCYKINFETLQLNNSVGINLKNTFKNCYELKGNLTLSRDIVFEEIEGAFDRCEFLKIKQIFYANLNKPTSFKNTFRGCKNLDNVFNLRLNNGKVTSFEGTFEDTITSGCAIIEVDVTELVSTERMFKNNNRGGSINRSQQNDIHTNTLLLQNTSEMFSGCERGDRIYFEFNPINLEYADKMYYNCRKFNEPVLLSEAKKLKSANLILGGCYEFDNIFEFNSPQLSEINIFEPEKGLVINSLKEDINPLYWDNFFDKFTELNEAILLNENVFVTPKGLSIINDFKLNNKLIINDEKFVPKLQEPLIFKTITPLNAILNFDSLFNENYNKNYFSELPKYNNFCISKDITSNAKITEPINNQNKNSGNLNSIPNGSKDNEGLYSTYFWGKIYSFNLFNNGIFSDFMRSASNRIIGGNVLRKGFVLGTDTEGFSSLKSLELSKIDTLINNRKIFLTNYYNLDYCFSYCEKLTEITGLTDFYDSKDYVSSVGFHYNNILLKEAIKLNFISINMKQMYYNCNKMIKAYSLNWSETVSCEEMYMHCSEMIEIDTLRTTNIPKCVSTKGMFKYCKKYNNNLNLSLSSLEDASEMFYECTLLNSTVHFNEVENLKTVKNLFYRCRNFNSEFRLFYFGSSFKISDFSGMFYECDNFNHESIKLLFTVNGTDFSNMFYGCKEFNQDLIYNSALSIQWNVSNGENFSGMFSGCIKFNGLLTGWNTESATNFESFLNGCSVFNQPVNHFKMDNVINLSSMFYNNEIFNQPISNWNVSNVENFYGMFYNCSVFNQSFENWNTKSATNFRQMLRGCVLFNSPISGLKADNVTFISEMFRSCREFNQPINSLYNHKSTTTYMMFFGCREFNQDVKLMNVSKVTNFESMFEDCFVFNKDFDGWNVENGVNFKKMFKNCKEFNGTFGGWNTIKAENFDNFLYFCHKFNQPLKHFNVSSVTDLGGMLGYCKVFNQDFEGWNTSKVTNFGGMLSGCNKFDKQFNLNTRNALNLAHLFNGCSSLTQTINLDTSSAKNIDYLFFNCYSLTDFSISTLANVESEFSNIIKDSSKISVNSYDKLLRTLDETYTGSFRTLYMDNLSYTSGWIYRQNLINKGWKFITDKVNNNPNLLKIGEVVDNIRLRASNIPPTYLTNFGENTNLKSEMVTNFIDIEGMEYINYKHNMQSGLYLGDSYIIYDKNFNILRHNQFSDDINEMVFKILPDYKYIRFGFGGNMLPSMKIEEGELSTEKKDNYFNRENIIKPSRKFVLSSNNSYIYPVLWQSFDTPVPYVTVTPRTNTTQKSISLYTGTKADGSTSSMLMDLNFGNKYLIFSFDAYFDRRSEIGEGKDYIKFQGYYQYTKNGEIMQRKTPVIMTESSNKIGWQRIWGITSIINVNPSDYFDSSILRFNMFIVNENEEFKEDIEPNMDYLYAKNFKIEVVDNPTDLPSPYSDSTLEVIPNILKKANNFVYNYQKYQGTEITLVNGNEIVPEWSASDAKRIRIKGGTDYVYCFAPQDNLPFSTPYTYMCYVKNPSDKWIFFRINGLKVKNPEDASSPNVSQWLPPNFTGQIIFKGWTRHNYNFIQYRYISVALEKDSSKFVKGAEVELIFWREKLYEGHADSIWSKGTED